MTKKNTQEGTFSIPGNLHVPEDCRAVSEVLSRVGDKWTVLVVSTLGDGPKRFNELRKALGSISQRMLTLTLRGARARRAGHAHGVPEHPAAGGLRVDQTRPFAARAGERARAVGAEEPLRHPGCAPPIRCHQSNQLAMAQFWRLPFSSADAYILIRP